VNDIETLNQYQVEALRTAALSPDLDFRRTILALGIAGEAGEVADIIKKEVGHRHYEDASVMAKELGDVLWYIAVLADAYGHSLSDIASINIAKLKARYPDGFSTEASINRWEDDGGHA
jgi:NTP pyrophosphatase (non-canonical NTP hydrolase)